MGFAASTARSDTSRRPWCAIADCRATRDGRAFGRSRGARGCVKGRARRPQTEERPRRRIGLCRGATRALTQGPRPEPRPSVATRPGSRCDLGQSQLGSGIGTNAKNLRGRSRDIRDRMSDTGQPRQSACLLASRRNARNQAACNIDDKPSIILIRALSIIVTTLNTQFRWPSRKNRYKRCPTLASHLRQISFRTLAIVQAKHISEFLGWFGQHLS